MESNTSAETHTWTLTKYKSETLQLLKSDPDSKHSCCSMHYVKILQPKYQVNKLFPVPNYHTFPVPNYHTKSSMISVSQHKTQDSSQLFYPREPKWTMQLVWTFSRRQKYCATASNQTVIPQSFSTYPSN